MEFREQGYEDDRFQSDVSRSLHCAICLNVFKDPVMCQTNQHFFCRPCITRHLQNSHTCPTCMGELTLETLNQAPRILTDCLSELTIRCDYSNRGCREFVQLGDLESHVKNCGFSPVVCSNQGCLVEIDKRDRIYHETEVCEFRKVKCHDCCELRKDMEGMKINMTTLTEKLVEIERNQTAVVDEIQAMKMKADIQIKEMNMNQTKANDEMKMNLEEIKDQLATLTHQMAHCIPVDREKAVNVTQEAEAESRKANVSVVVLGGYNGRLRLDSVEKFCWINKSWSQLMPMNERRHAAASFVYKNRLIVTGGLTGNGRTDTMERVNINPVMGSEPWFDFPAKLPIKMSNHGSIVYEERLIVIGGYNGHGYCDNIYEVLLVPPYTSKLLARMPQARCNHGVQLFNDKILICGGSKTLFREDSFDSVIMYDITKNECKQMSPLPYRVLYMATVSWGDNVIVIGGLNKDGKVLNSVVIYNVKTEKSHMLPAMKYKRRGCVAVVVGNSIVVMGGVDERGNYLNSVESFSFDRYSWEDLPKMNEARWMATAVAW